MKLPITTKLTQILALALLAAPVAPGLRAQMASAPSTPPPSATPTTTPPPSMTSTSPTPPSAGSTDVTTLEKYTVSDVPVSEQVLPTVRPIGDVMGDDRSIIDTPRSVSSVNEAWMKDRMVKNAMDFGQFSPGVYSAAQYGIPAVPFIRGDLSQIYVDGQIAIFSRNSTPPSFNGTAAFDIVKGPGSAVYGPQGEGAGGYIDMVMKQPYFDRFHFDIDATYGYWTSGHSYSNPEATFDFGGPVSDKLAYRFSYLSRYGDGYYINDHDETQDIYGALTYLPNANLRIDWWAQLYSDRTNEISGVNRVTEKFIEKGTYIGGPATTATSGPNAYFGYDIFTTPTPAAGSFPSTPDGSYALVNPNTAYTVKLPAYDSLIGNQDTARSKLFHTQIKAVLTLTPDSSLVNRAYFALGKSDKFETYGYDEYVPKQQSIQDRIEFHDKFMLGPIGNNLITGFDFRYSALTSYQDFATEPFGYYDIYTGLANIHYPGYTPENNTFGGGLQIPGAPGYSAYAYTSGNQISHIYDPALFLQDDIKLTPQLSLTPGYRVDRISADTRNPAFVQAGYYDAYFDYLPLAKPIYIPAGGSSPYYSGFNVSDTKTDQSYFLSLSFKLNEESSFYLTYDHVDAILGSSNFGGVNVSSGGTKQSLDRSLTTKSTLYEGGYKQSFLHNTLYFSAALFQQIKLGTQITGATFPIKDQGLELESVYQPSKTWTFNANFTYQNATAFGTSYFQESGNYLDYYPTTMVVDGKPGTGVGAVNFGSYVPPTGRMRAAGIPQVQANGFVQYKSPMGWGVGLGPQIIGKQYANDQDTLHIPSEMELDGYVFYGTKTWDVRVNIKNMTNARLLDPIDVSFAGNDTVFVRPPISASLTVRVHL
jgi:outer membrane receptor for monomeric catechols